MLATLYHHQRHRWFLVWGPPTTSVARRRRRRLVLPSWSSLLISLFLRLSCRLYIALCSSSDSWGLPWQLDAQRSRTNMLPTQWRLHAAAFYDRLTCRMCLCRVALSCSHCDIINQTLQIRRIGYRSAVALSSPMLQITANVPMSDVRHLYCSDTKDDI